MRLNIFIVLLLSGLLATGAGAAPKGRKTAAKPKPLPVLAQTHIDGYLGERINACIRLRVIGENEEALVAPFRSQRETSQWQSEFWGKWTLGAVAAYRYNGDPELLAKIKRGAAGILAAQSPDGYIGNYAPGARLTNWDVWGQKYTLLGLLACYDLTGDKKILEGAVRLGDYLLEQIPAKQRIVRASLYRGMPSSSILEPVVYLYQRTMDPRYLDFAKHIVAEWETPEGPQLISKALAGVPVADRFPLPAGTTQWWVWENGQKAYEMMSCYDGLLELYKITGQADYLKAAEMTARNIIDEEINVAGSGAASECFYHGRSRQTEPFYHTMETCVTMSWMKLCANLLEVTHDPVYADQIERSAYNAMLASLKEDAAQMAMYTPLEGIRQANPPQCGMHLNCCSANGPRAFVMLPRVAVTQGERTLYVNLYGPSSSKAVLGGTEVLLEQRTTYPEDGQVEIVLNPRKETDFSLALRIPTWSRIVRVSVNGEALSDVQPGSYRTIARKWKSGDKVLLQFDMRGRLVELNGYQAVERGPVVLARDWRFVDGFVDEACRIQAADGYVELFPVSDKPEKMWMAFTAPMQLLGRDPAIAGQEPAPVKLCDFASAGNTWNREGRYRVWLPLIR